MQAQRDEGADEQRTGLRPGDPDMCVVTGTSGTLNADVPMITAVCLGEVKLRDGPGSLKQW